MDQIPSCERFDWLFVLSEQVWVWTSGGADRDKRGKVLEIYMNNVFDTESFLVYVYGS